MIYTEIESETGTALQGESSIWPPDKIQTERKRQKN